MKQFILVSIGHWGPPDDGLTKGGEQEMRGVNDYLLRIISPGSKVFVLRTNTPEARQSTDVAMSGIAHNLSLSVWCDIDPGARSSVISRGEEEIQKLVRDYDSNDVVIVFTNFDGARLFPNAFKKAFLGRLRNLEYFPVVMNLYGGVMVFDFEKEEVETPPLG